MATQRLDKILAGQGFGSRREIAALVRARKISVNGEICTAFDRKIQPTRDKLMVDGETVTYHENWYVMLHKPAGVITATEDKQHQTVLSLLPARLQSVGLFPVGRLDKDTEGLLLLTTDGAFDHALMSPKKHVSKVYEAQVDAAPERGAEARFAAGLTLTDGTVCRPATLCRLAPDLVRVTLCEGKFHQVKRMLAAVGSGVITLRRTQIGALPLDAALAPGQARELTEEERALLLCAEQKE